MNLAVQSLASAILPRSRVQAKKIEALAFIVRFPLLKSDRQSCPLGYPK